MIMADLNDVSAVTESLGEAVRQWSKFQMLIKCFLDDLLL